MWAVAKSQSHLSLIVICQPYPITCVRSRSLRIAMVLVVQLMTNSPGAQALPFLLVGAWGICISRSILAIAERASDNDGSAYCGAVLSHSSRSRRKSIPQALPIFNYTPSGPNVNGEKSGQTVCVCCVTWAAYLVIKIRIRRDV